MVPWLIASLFTIVFSLPVGIFATIGSFNAELSRLRLTRENLSSVMAAERRHENFYPVLIWIICTPFECYIWNVVFCLYKEIRIGIRKRHGVRNIVLMHPRMHQMDHSKSGHSRRIWNSAQSPLSINQIMIHHFNIFICGFKHYFTIINVTA